MSESTIRSRLESDFSDYVFKKGKSEGKPSNEVDTKKLESIFSDNKISREEYQELKNLYLGKNPSEDDLKIFDSALESALGLSIENIQKAGNEPVEIKFNPKKALENSADFARINGYIGNEQVSAEDDDVTTLETFDEIRNTLNNEVNSGKVKPENYKAQIIDRMLEELCAEKFKDLPKEKKEALRKFLGTFSLNELVGVEQQNQGGSAKGRGVTGTGSEGHYTNSIMSSVSALINTNRLTLGVMQAIENLAGSKLHPDLSDQRNALLRSSLQEIAFPETINQHARGTCAATTVQIHLAVNDPAKYLKVVEGLASPEGKIAKEVIPGKISREDGTTKGDDSGRSLSSRLIQPAFMETANDISIFRNDYNNKTDRHYFLGLIDARSGLFQDESVNLLNALYGKNAFKEFNGSGKDLLPKIEEALKKGETVPVGMNWNGEGHQVLITKIDQKNNLAFFMNPWGELQTMPLDDLTSRLRNAAIPVNPKGNQEALTNLPGKAGEPENYRMIDPCRYRTFDEHFDYLPGIKDLSPSQRDILHDKFKALDLNSTFLDLFVETMANGRLPKEEMIESVAGIKDNIQAINLFILCQTVDLNVKEGRISKEKAKEIIGCHPEKYLTDSDNSKMNMLLNSTEFEDPKDYLARIDSILVKAKGAMINELMEGKTFASAETKIAGLINETSLEGKPSATLQLLEKLDPAKLADELENDQEATAVLTHFAEACKNSDSLPEPKLGKFISTLSEQHRSEALNSFFNNPEMKAVISSFSTAESKGFIKNLMAGNTDKDEEKAIVSVLKNLPESRLKEVFSDREFTKSLVSEIEAGEIGKLMKKFADQGDWQSLNTFFSAVKSENDGISDDLAESLISGLNDRQLGEIPGEILKKIHSSLAEGWTTDGERVMMSRIEKSKNWQK